MGPCEQIMLEKINKWISEWTIEHNLNKVMKYPELVEFNPKELKALSVSVSVVLADGSEKNKYECLNIEFEVLNGDRVVLSFDEYEFFGGIYHLNDYLIFYSEFNGTELESNGHGEHTTFEWLEDLLNEADFVEFVKSDLDLYYKVWTEVAEKCLPSLSDVQKLTTEISRVELNCIESAILTFSNGATLRVELDSLHNSIYEQTSKEKIIEQPNV